MTRPGDWVTRVQRSPLFGEDARMRRMAKQFGLDSSRDNGARNRSFPYDIVIAGGVARLTTA